MSSVSIPENAAPAQATARRLWIATAVVAGLGAVAFGLAFWNEINHAVAVWLASTAYGHCFLILPISMFLVWERRSALLARMPEPTFLPVIAMIPVGIGWLLALQIGVMEGRQLAAMTLLELFFLAILGFRAWRVIAFALLYLYFLVPVGAFLVPALQEFSARFAVAGVRLLGIPVFADGMYIEVPGAKFVVAEACAGLRFLIAAVAVGTIYGYMIYRTWVRRVTFVAVSIVVPIIANGFRVLGIVLLGYYLNSAEAATADHLIYGWVFFSFVLLILFMVGLPFRQPPTAFPVAQISVPTSRRSQSMTFWVGAAVIAFVAILANPVVDQGPLGTAFGSAASGIKHAIGR